MDEREAYELFAPARERTLPQPRISMAEVYEQDARRRRGHRRVATAATVVVVVAAVVGTMLAVGPGAGRTSRSTGPGTSSASPTPPATPSSNPAPEVPALAAALGALRPPAGSTPVTVQPDQVPLYAGQPGYRQQVLAWTTSLDPAKAYAAMHGLPPEGMSGGITSSSGPGKGPAETDGSYQAAKTPQLLGPRLDISAVANPDGTTTITAVAWQIDLSAKPADDVVHGVVGSVTATYSQLGGIDRTATVVGAQARDLATAVNGLLVATGIALDHCGVNSPSVRLVFHTSTGDQTFVDRCSTVSPLPDSGHTPLVTSDELNLAVNRDFADLMPRPLASSAPLPSSGPSPSFAPTPGIGTLDISINVSGGPAPGVHPDWAGTITVKQGARTVAHGKVAQGHHLSVHLPVGTYQVLADIGVGCPAVTVKAESGGVTPVTAHCDVR